MAEETAQQLERVDPDEQAIGAHFRGSSITEVAMAHATGTDVVVDLAESTRPSLANSDVDIAEEIVVDLRSVDLEGRPAISAEIVDIREFPAAPDFESLVPARTGSHTEVVGPPIGGLAAATAAQRLAKRAIDLVISFIALVVLAPLMLIVAALVVVTSPGPALYRSTRVAKDGRAFAFFKFRTMYNGADLDRQKVAALNEQTGPVFKIQRDPRTTPLGRLLRRTSIDELPQLLHVLGGTMSLVGPRPAIPREVEAYDDHIRQRLLVKPGITCIWQVSGRSTLDFDTWVDMDLEYIKSWSIFGDLSLLIRTVPAVIGGKGAF